MKQNILLLTTVILCSMPACMSVHNNQTPTKGPKPKPVEQKQTAKQKQDDKKMKNLKTGESIDLSTFTKTKEGLLYLTTVQAPESAAKVRNGEQATVHYTGWLLNGNMTGNLQDGNSLGIKFDSSRDRQQPFKFIVGSGMVIKGWDLTVADMKVGERRLIVLPHYLAYGSRGAGSSIPPHATLVFDVEVISAQ